MDLEALSSQQIKSWATDVGFQDCGIARARVLTEAEAEFQHSIESGLHADMHYLERNIDNRFNPESLLSDCKSVIVVTYNYLTDSEPKSDKYRTARYTWIQDYHILVKNLLEQLAVRIVKEYPTVKYRSTVDSSAISEKRWAM